MDEAGGPGLGGWLWGERGNILTLLTFIGSSLLTLLIFYVPYLEGQLRANPAYRHLRARQLAHPRVIGLYRGSLVSSLDGLDHWMGRPGDWRRGFDWCLKAGLVYSFGFMLLAWVLGAPATLGELVFLPDPAEVPIWRRLLTVGLIAGGSAFAYLALRHGEQVEALLDAWLADRLPAAWGEERRRRVARWLPRSAAAALTFAMLRFGVGFGPGAAVAVAGTLAVAAALALVLAGTLAGAVAGSLGLMNAAPMAFAATNFALFAVLLPLLNAIFDWLSWLVGRWLGRDLATRLDPDGPGGWRRAGAFALHVGADVALAMVSLVGLAWGIPRAIGLFNAGLRGLGLPTPLALDHYLCRSALDPLGEGLWASLTLLSTFVPTAVHLAFLLAAPFAWLLSRGEVWQERARHLRGQGPPPAVDLGPDAAAGASADTLHPETIRQVALHLALVRWTLWAMAFLVAGALIWAGLELLALDWGSLSRLLLHVATGDPAAVATCFGDGATLVRASAAPP